MIQKILFFWEKKIIYNLLYDFNFANDMVKNEGVKPSFRGCLKVWLILIFKMFFYLKIF